jgi:hypothetical protein
MCRITLPVLFAGIISLSLVGCGAGDDPNFGKKGQGAEALKIMNAEGEASVLRTGTALSIRALGQDLKLESNTVYKVTVTNVDTGSKVSEASLLSDMLGDLELTTVAHDLGEFDDVKDEHRIGIAVHDATTGQKVADVSLPVTPHIPDFIGHGFQVDEIQPPHIYTCAADQSVGSGCKPLNSFVVGALPDDGEVAAPIYAAGKGFPAGVKTVDLYIMKDADKWQGKTIPLPGDPAYIAGPITGTVDRGVLRPTALSWTPGKADIGPYDVLVDVDRNGRFDYSFASKDAADGEDKVGVTIQLGAAYFRAQKATAKAKLSVDAAKAGYDAADKAATEAEKIATGPDAKAKAQQARDEANLAKAKWQEAKTAGATADGELAKELVSDTTCEGQADIADAAAKAAADHADKAAKLVNDTKQAQAAHEAKMKALAAKITSAHYLVNLAFSSKSRSGKWQNEFTTQDKIYSYVNPPMQSGARHAFVAKLVVKHQSWTKFWNNPDMIEPGGKGGVGRIPIAKLVVQTTGGKVQNSCTNSPPVAIINPGVLPIDNTVGLLKYDIVFDYDNDGYYDIGRDMLDVIGHSNSGKAISAKDLAQLSDDQIFGFAVTKK